MTLPNTLYPGKAGSPSTVTTALFTAGVDTSITLEDTSVLPSATNRFTIIKADRSAYATLTYTAIASGTTLTGVTFEEGSSIAYPIGSIVMRNYSNADNTGIINDINYLESAKVDKVTGSSLVPDTKVTSYDSHLTSTSNPHSVTKSQIGLGNCDNTADTDKPISTATQTALDLKVDKVTGKGLSTNDYTTAEKTKLAGIESGAEVNVQSNWTETDTTSDAYIKNKPSTFTPSTHASTHGANGTDALTIAESQVTNLVTDLSNKADTDDVPTALSQLTDDSTHRVVTDTEKATWNGKQDALTFDDTPTASSTNPVKSGGVKTALNAKQDLLSSTNKLSADYVSDTGTTNKFNVQGDWNSDSGLSQVLNRPFKTVGTGLSITNNILTADTQFKFQIFSTLPTASSTYAQTIALILKSTTESGNVYDEYGCVNTTGDTWVWERIGGTSFTLSIVQNNSGITINDTALQTGNSNRAGLITSTDWTTFNGKQDALTWDSTPTESSTNPVRSGGVYDSLEDKVDKVSGKSLVDDSKVTAYDTHIADTTIHVTTSDKTAWNNKADTDDIPTALSELTDDSTHRLVTDAQKTEWSGKQDEITSSNMLSYSLISVDTNHQFVSDTEKSTWTNKQSAITSSNMLDADLVDDSTSDNLFVTASEKSTWTNKQSKIPAGTSGNLVTYSGTEGTVGSVSVDSTPTSGSTNPVTSGGVKTELDKKVAISQGILNANKQLVTDADGNVTTAVLSNPTIYTVRIYKNKSATSGDGVLEVYSSNPTDDLSDATGTGANAWDNRMAIIQRFCRHCLVTKNLASITYVDETNFELDADGNAVSLDGTNGDFMLEIDTMYWKSYDYGTYWDIKFSTFEFDSGCASNHLFNGTIRSHRYIGVFNGYKNSNNQLCSISTSDYPTVSQNIDTFYTQARDNGSSMTENTYGIRNMMDRTLLVLLHLFVYKTKNIQSIVRGLNKGSGSSVADAGAVNADFSATGGWTQGTTDDYDHCCMTLGIMNLYGKIWNFDGETIANGGGYKFATDAHDHYAVATGTYAGAPATWAEVTGCDTNTTTGCISEIRGDTFLPFKPSAKNTSASYSQYYADCGWYAEGDRCALSGAHVASSSGRAGLFAASADSAVSHSAWCIGSRLACSSTE